MGLSAQIVYIKENYGYLRTIEKERPLGIYGKKQPSRTTERPDGDHLVSNKYPYPPPALISDHSSIVFDITGICFFRSM